MRIALLDHAGEPDAQELAAGLELAGHRVRRLSSSRASGVDGLLRRRGFTGPLAHVPLTVAALASRGFDLAHSFSPPDALAALAWRRLTGRPVVFTCTEVLARETVADTRLRLELLRRATEDTNAVTATTAPAREAMSRWLAIDAPLLEPADVAGYERLYEVLLARHGSD